jgi:hypothetical protein
MITSFVLGEEESKNQLLPNHQPYIIEADISAFKIGSNISFWQIPPRQVKMIVNPNQFLSFFIVVSDGIRFDVAYSDDDIVKFIGVRNTSPEQTNFKTPEGISLNMKYRDVRKRLFFMKLKPLRIIGYYKKLKSGWVIVFYTGKTGVDYYPNDNDAITWIFKTEDSGYFQ